MTDVNGFTMTAKHGNHEAKQERQDSKNGSSGIDMRRIGRRSFIKTVGTVALTTSVVSASNDLREFNVDYDPNREVPRVYALKHKNHKEVVNNGAIPDRKPVIGFVSREKWRVVEAADRARARIENQLSDLEPTPSVMIRLPSGSDEESRRKIVIKHEVRVDREDGSIISSPNYSFEELKEIVKDRFQDVVSARPSTTTHPASPLESVPINNPTPVDNMKIETEEVRVGRSSHNGGGSHYDYEYRNPGVPAGCLIKSDFPATGTLGPPATGSSGRVFVTAGHLLGSDYSTGNYVYQETQSDNYDRLGTIQGSTVTVGNDFDAGVIGSLNLDDTNQFASDSGSDQYTIESIYGIRTRSWMKDNQNKYIRKQGVSTGRQSGLIGDVGKTAFESDHSESGGDSGGPYWDTEAMDDSYIVGIHEGPATDHYSENSRGTIMDAIEDEFNVHV